MDFSGKVAIVTGAGAGLGRAYAIELGRRGASVVVNGRKGVAGAGSKVLQVVEAIAAAGGEAFAFEGDVADAAQMQEMADAVVDRWGRIDILINNAGIMRSAPFADLSIADLHDVITVNLLGTVNATKAVWGQMVRQKYGRILMSTSAVGLWGGNHGQSNYGASKMGIVGLAKTLRIEGAASNIHINSIIPAAHTQMSAGILPDHLQAGFSTDRVLPAALALVSDEAPSGAIIGAGGGLFHGAWVTMNEGAVLSPDQWTPEAFMANWDRIVDRSSEFVPVSGADEAKLIVQAIES